MSSKKKIQRRLLSEAETALLPRAGLLRRLAALLYDMFLVFAMWMILGFIILFVFGLFADNTSELVDGQVQTHPVLLMLNFVMMVTTAACFYLWFWRRTGQTLGMIAWRIKALRTDNKPISLQHGLIRFVAAWPAFWLGGLGYLWLYVDKDHDAVHEKLSGTKTVLLPKDARPF
ncbi:RDD family protein [Pseudohongiella sp.]|uniref:RDD domain-containing protein n=1 Tax=marine sediment metagenome TaxID=412755 RepID=A0A0F9YKX2_9ZZZZ|nr:RDD family protein [Pseudohongiella sp.]HDZ09520.1 RDD family protein [Pseudohongiella sp.]HEA62186.1 RDD family protein [Pseudohongiella sp.]